MFTCFGVMVTMVTTDMTGRNSVRNPSSHWMLVKALDTNKFEPRRDIAEIDGVSRQVKAFGYYIFEATG